MKGITYRNKNEGKKDANGKAKKANWCYRFEMAKVGGVRKFMEKSGFATKKETLVSVAGYFPLWSKLYGRHVRKLISSHGFMGITPDLVLLNP